MVGAEDLKAAQTVLLTELPFKGQQHPPVGSHEEIDTVSPGALTGSNLHNSVHYISICTKGLVTNYGEGGGGTKREGGGGGASEVLPLRKGGGRKRFSHAEGGAQQVLR